MIFKLFITIYLTCSVILAHGEDHSHNDNHKHKEQKYEPIGIVRGSVIDNMLEDPKAYDNTPQQGEKYRERSLQIATELKYVFSNIKQ